MNENDKMLREVATSIVKSLKDFDISTSALVIAQDQLQEKLMKYAFDEEEAIELSSYLLVDLSEMIVTDDTIETINIFTDSIAEILSKYSDLLFEKELSDKLRMLRLIQLSKKISLTFTIS